MKYTSFCLKAQRATFQQLFRKKEVHIRSKDKISNYHLKIDMNVPFM